MNTVLPMIRGTHRPKPIARVYIVRRAVDSEIQESFRQLQAEVVPVDSVEELLLHADDSAWGCVVIDDALLTGEAFAPMATFIKERPGLPCVAWSHSVDVPLAVQAVKHGVLEVLRAPEDNARLLPAIQEALQVGWERFLAWSEYRDVLHRFGELSSNEKSVLSLVLQGRTNKEIASHLDCSLRTVEARRQRMLRVMRTENAIEVAVVLARHGLMEEAVGIAAEATPAVQHDPAHEGVHALHNGSATA